MSNIYVLYNDKADGTISTLLDLLEIEKDIKKLGKKNPFIIIKPNLAVAQRSDWGATTSPELTAGVVEYLHKMNFYNIAIAESSWAGDDTKKAFKECGYEDISREYNIKLIDLKEDECQELIVDKKKVQICNNVLKADYIINMPVLKAHCQTKITCALKNLKGCIPDEEKRRFHSVDLHQAIAYLNKLIFTNLIIVDGIIGDLSYEGGGTPVRMNRILAGKDPVLVDTYAALLLGYSPHDIRYLKIAEELKIGNTALTEDFIYELNSNKNLIHLNSIMSSQDVDYLLEWIIDDKACSACYGSLIYALKRLKEKGELHKIPQKIYIGQGYENIKFQELGIGTCTKEFINNVPGCPPTAKNIIDFLEVWLHT